MSTVFAGIISQAVKLALTLEFPTAIAIADVVVAIRTLSVVATVLLIDSQVLLMELRVFFAGDVAAADDGAASWPLTQCRFGFGLNRCWC